MDSFNGNECNFYNLGDVMRVSFIEGYYHITTAPDMSKISQRTGLEEITPKRLAILRLFEDGFTTAKLISEEVGISPSGASFALNWLSHKGYIDYGGKHRNELFKEKARKKSICLGLIKDGVLNIPDLLKGTGVSRNTLYQYLRELDKGRFIKYTPGKATQPALIIFVRME